MQTLNEVLKLILIRLLKVSVELVDDIGYQLNLSIIKNMIQKKTGNSAVYLGRIEELLEKD